MLAFYKMISVLRSWDYQNLRAITSMIPEYKLYVLKDNDNLDSFLSYNIQVASNISIKTAFNGNQLIVTKCKYKS